MKKAGRPADHVDETTTRPCYRTGAVARMLRMPAATLRIWERRYGVAAPATTLSGHRQYSAADVQRLALIRQLTSVGHPIGALADLKMEQLREVASTHAGVALAPSIEVNPRRRPAWKVAAVGDSAEHRLQRPAVQMRLGRALRVACAFEQLQDVRRGARTTGSRHDALIVFAEGLQGSTLRQVQAAATLLRARRIGVIYSFATASVAHSFVAAGIAMLREPVDDAQLAAWMAALAQPARGREATAIEGTAPPEQLPVFAARPAPRRYGDAALADFAELSSTIACECPRHLAEIVMKLSHFEAYSSQCEHLNAADAALHAYLGQVSGTARSLFEAALERVAIHEGLVHP